MPGNHERSDTRHHQFRRARSAGSRVSPQMAYDYYASGANDEITLRENRVACERIALHPRMLGDKGTGQNVAKISALWACSYAPKGLRGFSPGFQPGFNPGNRPINGSALKGRKLTWINPTRIAPQNELRRHAPPIGVRRTARMAFDFWWRK